MVNKPDTRIRPFIVGAPTNGAAPLVSVIVTNYNYAAYLTDCLDSVLAQTYPYIEVIVVDDGSTDESRTILRRFESRIRTVFKTNGGQGSAFNAGFAVSCGELACFVDSDDTLSSTAVAHAMSLFDDSNVVKVHWPLSITDRRGSPTGEQMLPNLTAGDYRDHIRRFGPFTDALKSAPSSGNIYTRGFLEEVMPVPSSTFRTSADAYLYGLAPAFGTIGCIAEPHGTYRLHGENIYRSGQSPFAAKLESGLSIYETVTDVLRRRYAREGSPVDVAEWRRHAWWPRIAESVREILAFVPVDGTFILVDDGWWGTDACVEGRRRIPLMEHEGVYWGAPENDDEAIDAIEKFASEADALAFGWPSFWWMDEYPRLAAYLARQFPCALRNDRLMLFDLRGTVAADRLTEMRSLRLEVRG